MLCSNCVARRVRLLVLSIAPDPADYAVLSMAVAAVLIIIQHLVLTAAVKHAFGHAFNFGLKSRVESHSAKFPHRHGPRVYHITTRLVEHSVVASLLLNIMPRFVLNTALTAAHHYVKRNESAVAC